MVVNLCARTLLPQNDALNRIAPGVILVGDERAGAGGERSNSFPGAYS